ncbi:MAG: M28 family peptidase [Candidatus Aegiribacteria sp.]|nr:M28 family peptidase [Candidatus Aegiribacteria sp.]MBD3295085.1 M28 family peptidase [Candidatus Fermentibacteria bacterium]
MADITPISTSSRVERSRTCEAKIASSPTLEPPFSSWPQDAVKIFFMAGIYLMLHANSFSWRFRLCFSILSPAGTLSWKQSFYSIRVGRFINMTGFKMTKAVQLLVLIAFSSIASQMVLVDGSLPAERTDLLPEGSLLVFEAADYFVTIVPSNSIPNNPRTTVLDQGDVAPEDYLLVHFSSERGSEHLHELGTTVLERDDIAIVKLEGPRPEHFVRDGIFFVQPLRVKMTAETIEESFQYSPYSGVDDDVADMVTAVSEDSIKYYIQHLEDYETRYSSTDNYDTACNWVEYKFEDWGLSAEQQTFPMSSYDCQNVIGELTGKTDSTKIYIICGHLDSTSPSPSTDAPGADDNGSGSTAVVEAARVLSGYEFDYTVRFICFGGEEQGLYGSDYYASQASATGDDILGVVNLDMILYAPPGNDVIWVPYDTQSNDLALAMEAICDTYVPALNVDIEYNPGVTYSDHASFWNNGYPALLGIEEEVFSNPYYHQTSDILSNYLTYFPFGTNCVRGAVATVAHLAQPIGPTGVAGSGEPVPGAVLSEIGPNPTDDLLTVAFGQGISGTVSISLFDITGRLVISRTHQASTGELEMNMSELPPGAYTLRAAAHGNSEFRSIVVTR